MRALRPHLPEVATAAFVLANLVAMEHWHGLETLPFHFIYIGVALMYGIRSWPLWPSLAVFGLIALTTGLLTARASSSGHEPWAELAEVPLMTLLCLAMVFHVESRRRAVELSRRLADERAEGLERERRFFSRASHELLTPITVARGHLELLGRRSAATSDEISATRDVAIGELDRMQSMVGELLLVAKLSSGAMEREQVGVAELVRGVATRWLSLPQREWQIRIDATGTIEGSPAALGRALESLIENAFRHTEPGERISIEACPRGSRVALAVMDSGPGIPADDLPRVFERFYRGAGGTSGAGAGLGLSIVRAVAEAHGGEARIESVQGLGTRVEIVVPRQLPSGAGRTQEPGRTEAAGPPLPAASASGSLAGV